MNKDEIIRLIITNYEAATELYEAAEKAKDEEKRLISGGVVSALSDILYDIYGGMDFLKHVNTH